MSDQADRRADQSDPEASEADQTADQSDRRVKPWTIKGISPEVRNAAIAAAERADMAIGEWLSRAIRTQIQADHQAGRAPVPVRPAAPLSQTDLGELERVVAAVRSLAEASGEPPPKRVQRLAYSALAARLQTGRGPTGRRGSPTGGAEQSDSTGGT